MQLMFFLYGFILNKPQIKTLEFTSLMCSNIQNLYMKPLTSGRDERYNSTEDHSELLLSIKTNIKKHDLIKKLVDPSIGIIQKQEYIEEFERTFGSYKETHNLSAGGLWDDFNTEI